MPIHDLLAIVVIPITVAALPLLWAITTSWIRRLQLRELILRELEEVGPYPLEKKSENGKNSWQDHHTQKRFLHREILDKPTENREVILSLPSSLVYHVNQLWNSKNDAEQWLYMLSKVAEEVPRWQSAHHKEIVKVRAQWYVLMREYGQSFDRRFVDQRILKSSLSENQNRRIRAAPQ